MTVAMLFLDIADELLYIVDIVIQMEFAFAGGYQAGVFPIGDIDLVVLQGGAHGFAQQRGVVARQGCDDEHHRLGLDFVQHFLVVGIAFEAQQIGKGFAHGDALMDADGFAIDHDLSDAEFGFDIVFA